MSLADSTVVEDCSARVDWSARPFPVDETHGIAGWHEHRLLGDSSHRAWSDAYTSHVRETPWHASLLASRHPCIAFCTGGSARIRRSVDGERATTSLLGTRQFGIVPADRPSTWQVDGNPRVQHLYLRREMFDDVTATELDLDPAVIELDVRIGVDDPLLEQLAVAILRAAEQPGNDLLVAHAARLVAHRLVGHHSNVAGTRTGRRSPGAERRARVDLGSIRDLVDARLDGDLSLTSLAQLTSLPATVLAETFRRQVGVTLHQFVMQRRLARASDLLATTDRPIVEIALACGFSHQSHMTNTFRRKVGTTPAAYRRERRSAPAASRSGGSDPDG